MVTRLGVEGGANGVRISVTIAGQTMHWRIRLCFASEKLQTGRCGWTRGVEPQTERECEAANNKRSAASIAVTVWIN